MMIYPRQTTLSLIVLILLPAGLAAKEDIRFRRLSIEDGLSQSSVESIVQDHSGFIWIATEDGLNRYDGYGFEVFRNDPDDPWSVSSSDIWALFVDSSGNVWAGTYAGGLNLFDPVTERFTRYLHDPDDPQSISSDRVRSITEDSRGYIWVGTRDGGLNRLDPDTGRFTRFTHDPEDEGSLPSDQIRFVLPDSENRIWVATDRGSCLFHEDRGTIFQLRAGDGPDSLSSESVRHIMRDGTGHLWISTVKGLNRYDPVSGRLRVYRHDPDDPSSIGIDSIRKTFLDSRGVVWVATSGGGASYYDKENDGFCTYRFRASDQQSLSNNSTRVIFEDRGGLIWIGTLGGGVNIYDPKTSRFKRYCHDPGDANSLADPIIWSIEQGPSGLIWFGTNRGHLISYDRKTDTFTDSSMIIPDAPGKTASYIRSMMWDDTGRLWLSSQRSGILRYDPRSGDITRVVDDPDDPRFMGHKTTRSIYQAAPGTIWFCAWDSGLYALDLPSWKFTRFRHDPGDDTSLSSDDVISILRDSEGVYWTGTALGLNRFELKDDSPVEFTKYFHDPADPRSISDSYVLSIHEHSGGDLYFGTMQGLSRLPKEGRDDPRFVRYFMKNGLPSNVVYGILEDPAGRLWLSTNHGISMFDPDTETFRNYDIQDGLHNNEFNSGAYTMTREGTFIFGGVSGATEFHPDSLRDSGYAAPVILTGFNIFDEPADLQRSIAFTEEIVLSYRDNFFSFEFASLDYTAPGRNSYSYKLEGLDREWTNAGHRRFAGYTQVDPGRYTFMVKGTNSDGVWSDMTASVRIIITPPFWRTWWFFTLVILAVSGGISSVIIYRVRQLLKFERLRSRIAADLHDDIGAGLTEISIMGNIIGSRLPEDSKSLVDTELAAIDRTSRGLIGSMSDIVWLVDPRRDTLFDLISRLSDSNKELLTSMGTELRVEDLESLRDIRLKMDYRHNLYLIFKEALSNCIKYSDCEKIELKVDLEGKTLRMRLTDDGRGFDASKATSGNGLRNMARRAELIEGILTIESSPGEGTVIEFEGRIN